MPDKAALLHALENARQHQRAFVAQLTQDERAEVGRPDRWSAKDMLIHTAVWTDRRVDGLEATARGEAAPLYEDYQHENESIFITYQDTPWDEVERWLEDVHQRVIAYVQAASEDVLNSADYVPTRKRPVWQALAGNRLLHVLFHLIDYHLARKRPDLARQLSDTAYALGNTLDESPAWRSELLYDRACVDALTGEPDRAVQGLGEALRLNPGLVEWSKTDPDLDSLRDRADFLALYD